MGPWTRIDLILASGPTIAAPEIDIVSLEREGLSADQAAQVDRLLADPDALRPAPSRFPQIRTGAHKSLLKVTTKAGEQETYVASADTPIPVLGDLISLVLSLGVRIDP